ncbi:unnamed protein product [Strongylus vulgaris]|uniref:Dynein heavy chain AAA 5 extension domain-containing protein n=1 Tax=Strongylus vulgaris TaxID=40348 RepID=A0A3P7IS16_STRVU|nr:unnamed protein product [Strongylus vulgaris]
MVWFSEEVVTTEMMFEHYLNRLRNVSIESDAVIAEDAAPTRSVTIQRQAAVALQSHFSPDGLVPLALNYALTNLDHVMVPTQQRLLSSFFAMMNYSVRSVITHDANQGDFPLGPEQVETYVTRSMLTNMIWAFSGDGKWKCRQQMSDFIRNSTTLTLPPNEQAPLIDYDVQLSGEWQPWLSRVPVMEIEAHRVAAADLVVPTVDTVRHEMLLSAWLSEHKPLVLCGPPGSGKVREHHQLLKFC